MSTLVLTRKDVARLLVMKDIITAVEQAFREWAEGRATMPPKSYLTVEHGDFRAMPASLPGAAGVKWVNVHPDNPGKGLPTVMAALVFNDPATGYPLAFMDATDITAYRTGAAGAIASRYLAGRNVRTLGLVGAGRQAYTQVLAHAEHFSFADVRVYDLLPQAAERLVKSLPGLPLRAASLIEAVQSDIVCTVTTAREPVVKRQWVLPGAHINAIGADAPGKEELEPAILSDAVVVVDDLEQSSKAGEINVPVSRGLYSVTQVHASLGEIVTGRKPGRTNDSEITVFDSTGLAIEDIAVARAVYRSASEKGIGVSVDLVGE